MHLRHGADTLSAQATIRAQTKSRSSSVLAGRLIIELDSWCLPDTHATAYRRDHLKSPAVMAAIDVDRKRIRYFHSRGLHALDDEDFDGAALRVDFPASDDHLPPYTEILRFDAGARLVGKELREEAVAGAKALSFKFARRKTFDAQPLLAELGRAWDAAMESIADLAA